MAYIKDYASLSQAILDFSHRASLAPYVDYFIQCAQEDIERDVLTQNIGDGIRFMEVPLADTSMLLTEDGEMIVPVPGDWLAPKVIKLNGPSGYVSTLALKASEWIYDRYPSRMADAVPIYMARVRLELGSSITVDDADVTMDATAPTIDNVPEAFVFGPYPDQVYSISGSYYTHTAALSSAITTNWMTANAPLLLLAACMVHASRFTKDAASMQMWQQDYGGRLEKFIGADKAERYSSGTLVISAA